MEKRPSAFVLTAAASPLTITVTAGSGSPLSSITLPVTGLWEIAVKNVNSNNNESVIFLITALWIIRPGGEGGLPSEVLLRKSRQLDPALVKSFIQVFSLVGW